jgi:hypothetical protein
LPCPSTIYSTCNIVIDKYTDPWPALRILDVWSDVYHVWYILLH